MYRSCISSIARVLCAGWLVTQTSQTYLTDNYPADVIEDAKLDTIGLIEKYKYPAETHFVTTDDNYVLQVHRIPRPYGKPVFLMHGLVDSSATWVLMRPSAALGYYLYDNGYDVWMGNARGNRYSLNHTILKPWTDMNFWAYSWHEIGYYDLPAMIDYVIAKTGYPKVAYFGHSQGTTSFWVMTSTRPQYNDKIAIMTAVAPVGFMHNARCGELHQPVIKRFLKQSKTMVQFFLRHNPQMLNYMFQSKQSVDLCEEVVWHLLGKDSESWNKTLFPIIIGHMPAGAAVGQVEHYLQLAEAKRFCQFDHGPSINQKRYGRATPPDYPLGKITAPVALYYTYNDLMANEMDVQAFAKQLANVVENRLYEPKKWNHVTLMWGIDARRRVHDRMLEVMRRYEVPAVIPRANRGNAAMYNGIRAGEEKRSD